MALRPLRRQHGVALLTAMLIVALIAIIGAGMLTQMNLARHRASNIFQSEQAWWYAVGIENWLGKILREDAQRNKIDTLDEPWAQPVDYLPLDGGALQGRVIDLQGRFNLNNLADVAPTNVNTNSNTNAENSDNNNQSANSTRTTNTQRGVESDPTVQLFERLIQLVADTDVVTARTIAESTVDWLDADNNPTLPNGAEDDYYLGLSPAYRAGDTRMVSPSELRLVKGVTPAIYRALLPYICTLPESTPINVDTAPAAVLASLAPDLPASAGKSLAESRAQKPWESVKEFTQDDAVAGRKIDTSTLSITTHFFLAQGEISVDRAQIRFYSVLQRADNGSVRTVRHSINVY